MTGSPEGSPLDDYRLNNNEAAANPSLPDRSPSAYELGSADYEETLGGDGQS